MKTILCYGDSNTYGLMQDLSSRYPRDVRWTGQLQNLLGEEYYVIEEGLSDRTTCFDDELKDFKNGLKYLVPCLETHSPVDLVVLSLGINDLKTRYSLSLFEASLGAERLVQFILESGFGPEHSAPKVLLVAPHQGVLQDNPFFREMFPELPRRSAEIQKYYEDVAKRNRVMFLNPEDRLEVNTSDGIHYTENGHRKLAELIADVIWNNL